MKLYIQASEIALTEQEVKERIPPEKLNLIQGQGVLQVYTLAHEGTSQPKVVGKGTQILRWPKAVIHRLSEKIKEGTKFFVGHGENTNSHDERKPVGEVLASFVKTIKGKLSSVIIGHFPDKQSITDMDVCSMEADIESDDASNVVDDINEVSGVALGNSNSEHAAFPGAMRLSTIQCFDIQSKKGDDEIVITVDEIKKGVRDLNLRPSQLFTLEDFKSDQSVGKVFTENGTLKTDNAKLTEDNETIKKTSSEAIRKSNIAEASGKLDTHLAEGFTPKQVTFIKRSFKPEDLEDLTDEGITKFVEDQKKEFTAQAKLFGTAENDTENLKRKDDETEEKSPEEAALEAMGV